MKRLMMIQKTETIGNKRRTTTITEAGITMKETPITKVKQDNGPEIPAFIIEWQNEKRKRKEGCYGHKGKTEERLI
jgi:hypothetical protein